MEDPKCPFCDETMKRHPSQMDAWYRLYVCGACHAELRQMLAAPQEAEKSPIQEQPVREPGNACPDCAQADLHCFSCDDPVCDSHIRTFEKYAHVFSPELGNRLIENHGNRIYCPLCFKAVFNRFSLEISKPAPKREKTFNLPVVLGLLALVLIIVLGVQRCDNASYLRGEDIGVEDRTQ